MDFKDIKNKFENTSYCYSPNNYGEEGVDHININLDSNYHLGRYLHPTYKQQFTSPYIGTFNSVINLWYYLKSLGDERLRYIDPFSIKDFIEKSKIPLHTNIPNFKAIIAHATWNKVINNPMVMRDIQALKEGTKLLSYHYFNSGKMRLCNPHGIFLVSICIPIVEAIRNNTVMTIDAENSDLEYLDGFLSMIRPQDAVDALRVDNCVGRDDEVYELENPEV